MKESEYAEKREKADVPDKFSEERRIRDLFYPRENRETDVIYKHKEIPLPNTEVIKELFPVFDIEHEVALPKELWRGSDYQQITYLSNELQKEVAESENDINNELNEEKLEKPSQVEKNREDGERREAEATKDLERMFPKEEGYAIQKEVYLCNEKGEIVKDPKTGEGRRVDIVVIKDGKVVKSVEVTSEIADKTKQVEKEERIRENGGNYVKDRQTGKIIPFSPGVKTEILRKP
ncbi:MAG: hypothetical protein OXC62_05260 [Aestuariivita sp.]|nr:hypothetical protein [Aestuariivita sp.]